MSRTTQHRDWGRLERVLDDKGIEPEAFEAQVVNAIEELVRAPGTDPSLAFSFAEAAVLPESGLDLAPRRKGEPDIIVKTATGLAVLEAKASTASDVARALRVTAARVRQRAQERTLYALRVDDEWRFPHWQFDEEARPLPGIPKVVAALPPRLHPLAVFRFMTEPNTDLELSDKPVSPLEWLRAGGEPEPVAAIAREL